MNSHGIFTAVSARPGRVAIPFALFASLALLLGLPSSSLAQNDGTAVTGNFTQNASLQPISADTTFNEGIWDVAGGDELNTATHELLHAIGFTIAYTKFATNVYNTPGAGANGIPVGSRVFSTDGTVGGILLVLTPASSQTHADPIATGAGFWPATGYNQTNDIMQPSLKLGAVVSAADKAALNAAFNWSGVGLNIAVNFNNFPNTTPDEIAERNAVNTAVQNIQTLFGNVPASANFTWNVTETPEPSSVVLAGLGGLVILYFLRFHGRKSA